MNAKRKYAPRVYGSAIERFWPKVNRGDPSGCWLWTAGVFKMGGYGQLNIGNGVIVRAHVFAYKILIGQVQKGMFVCHKCDVPRCVNPEHLFLGTQRDNMRDAAKKGRLIVGKQNKSVGLSEEEIEKIKNRVQRCHPTNSMRALSREFRVNLWTIRQIVRGKKLCSGGKYLYATY